MHFASLDAGLRGGKALHHLALACRQQGRLAEAVEQWNEVVAEQPEFAPAWLGLGEVYLAQQREAELDEQLRELARRAEAAVMPSRRLLGRQAFAEARRLPEEAVSGFPEAVWPWVILSHVLLQEGKDLEAAERVRRPILDLDPHHAEGRRNLEILLGRTDCQSVLRSLAGCLHCRRWPPNCGRRRCGRTRIRIRRRRALRCWRRWQLGTRL